MDSDMYRGQFLQRLYLPAPFRNYFRFWQPYFTSPNITEKRFLDISISNEGGQKSLKVRRVWDIRETLDFSVHLHWKWKNLGISSLLGLVHKLEIRLPEAKIVLEGCWVWQIGIEFEAFDELV